MEVKDEEGFEFTNHRFPFIGVGDEVVVVLVDYVVDHKGKAAGQVDWSLA